MLTAPTQQGRLAGGRAPYFSQAAKTRSVLLTDVLPLFEVVIKLLLGVKVLWSLVESAKNATPH
jgi:hypothetical protein